MGLGGGGQYRIHTTVQYTVYHALCSVLSKEHGTGGVNTGYTLQYTVYHALCSFISKENGTGGGSIQDIARYLSDKC